MMRSGLMGIAAVRTMVNAGSSSRFEHRVEGAFDLLRPDRQHRRRPSECRQMLRKQARPVRAGRVGRRKLRCDEDHASLAADHHVRAGRHADTRTGWGARPATRSTRRRCSTSQLKRARPSRNASARRAQTPGLARERGDTLCELHMVARLILEPHARHRGQHAAVAARGRCADGHTGQHVRVDLVRAPPARGSRSTVASGRGRYRARRRRERPARGRRDRARRRGPKRSTSR